MLIHELPTLTALLTVGYGWVVLLPRVVTAPTQTVMISDSITAYSKVVGPSTRLRKFWTRSLRLRMGSLLFECTLLSKRTRTRGKTRTGPTGTWKPLSLSVAWR